MVRDGRCGMRRVYVSRKAEVCRASAGSPKQKWLQQLEASMAVIPSNILVEAPTYGTSTLPFQMSMMSGALNGSGLGGASV